MFDIAPTELLLIVVVAVLVIGPKDMPVALRAVGRWIGQIRRVSGHFRSGLDAMIREAEMQEMEKKWREQNEKIMREHPANAVAEPEPTGAYPSQTAMQPLAQTGTQASGVTTDNAQPAASAEARAAQLANTQASASANPLPASAPLAGGAVAAAATVSAGVAAEAGVPRPAQGAPVLASGAPPLPTASEPVSAEARASAIAAATGGSFDGVKG